MNKVTILDPELFSVAAKNLRQQGVRSYLTLLGVVIGIAAIVALISIGDGLNLVATQQFESLGSNTIFVLPGGSSANSEGASSQSLLRDVDIRYIESIPGVEGTIPIYSTYAPVERGGEKVNLTIFGTDAKKSSLFLDSGFISIRDGRAVRTTDIYTAYVGATIADDSFRREVKPKSSIYINGQRFEVIAVIEPSAQSVGGGGPGTGETIFITEEAFRNVFDVEGTNFMFVKALTKDDVPQVTDRIQRYFDKKYGEKSFTVQGSDQLLEQVKGFLGIISMILIAIAAISLIVGGIGIMNAMVMTVLERTREIGVMKALGATQHTILALFLIESGAIGFIGGIIGIIVGVGLSQIVAIGGQAAGFNLAAPVTLELIGFALIFSVLVGALSGFYPAWRAAHMDPVEALRYE